MLGRTVKCVDSFISDQSEPLTGSVELLEAFFRWCHSPIPPFILKILPVDCFCQKADPPKLTGLFYSKNLFSLGVFVPTTNSQRCTPFRIRS